VTSRCTIVLQGNVLESVKRQTYIVKLLIILLLTEFNTPVALMVLIVWDSSRTLFLQLLGLLSPEL